MPSSSQRTYTMLLMAEDGLHTFGHEVNTSSSTEAVKRSRGLFPAETGAVRQHSAKRPPTLVHAHAERDTPTYRRK